MENTKLNQEWLEFYYPDMAEKPKHHLDRIEVLCILFAGSLAINLVQILIIILLSTKLR
jgi:hypothetical protein